MKKAETRKVRKVVKPLGDDDLFGDSGDIFSDIPSKPKGAKKKKSATTAPKDDIFAEEAAAGGSWCFFFCFFFVLFYFRFVYFIHCFADVLCSGANEDFVSEGIVSFHGKMRCSQLLTAQISSNEDLKEEK